MKIKPSGTNTENPEAIILITFEYLLLIPTD
jgi:hypothetical protein